jgi:hypothetical protein
LHTRAGLSANLVPLSTPGLRPSLHTFGSVLHATHLPSLGFLA